VNPEEPNMITGAKLSSDPRNQIRFKQNAPLWSDLRSVTTSEHRENGGRGPLLKIC
jgi:hypothetical protein